MSLLTGLRRVAVAIQKANNSEFNVPCDKQKRFLKKMGIPRNDIERSFYQYKAQRMVGKSLFNFAADIASIPLLIYYWLRRSDKIETYEKFDAVLFLDGKPENVVPSELRNRFKEVLNVESKKENLTKKDRKFFLDILKKYPFSWQFLLKCLIKIRFYSFELNAHQPEAFIVCNEYSFTSSLLTHYCEVNDVKHINVMHGEKLFYIGDSYFHFHKCYVWDNIYKALFIDLGAEPTQFCVCIPDSLIFHNHGPISKKNDFVYYLGDENKETIERIIEILNGLKARGAKVSIRPHPRYTDINVESINGVDFEVQDARKISIEESLLGTRYAVSAYSTVLYQAIHNGTIAVVDDVSRPELFKKLEDLRYVVLSMDHHLLSEYVEISFATE